MGAQVAPAIETTARPLTVTLPPVLSLPPRAEQLQQAQAHEHQAAQMQMQTEPTTTATEKDDTRRRSLAEKVNDFLTGNTLTGVR